MSVYTSKKGFFKRLINLFFSLIFFVVSGAVFALLLVIPLDEIQFGDFNFGDIQVGDTSLGEILKDNNMNVISLVTSFAKAIDQNVTIENPPTQDDFSNASIKYTSLTGKSNVTTMELSKFVQSLIAGESLPDSFKSKSVTLTDKEIAALLNNTLNEYLVTYEEIVFDNGNVECVIGIDITEFVHQIPETLKSIVKINADTLYITCQYELGYKDGTVFVENSTYRMGALTPEETQVFISILAGVSDFDTSLMDLSAQPILGFFNNIGTVGTDKDNLGLAGIDNGKVTIIIM